jgi:transposase
MTRVVSLDVHKNTCTYVVKEWENILAGPKRIPTTRPALTKLAAAYPGDVFAFEATAVSEWIHDVFVEAGVTPFVYKPFRKEGRGDKSDSKDALRGAAKFQVGELKQVYVPPIPIRELRDRIRARLFLVQTQTKFRNHVHGHLNRKDTGRELVPRDLQGRAVFTKAGRAAVEAAFPALRPTYDVLETLHANIRAADKDLELLARELRPVQRMRSTPGIGLHTSMALYAEIGDVARFANLEEIVSYFGLDPILDQSGDHVKDKHRISKEGRPYIRGMMAEATWVHVRTCPDSDLSRKYRETAARKGKPTAIMGTARRLLRTTVTLWKEDRDFTLNGSATSASPLAGRQAHA